MVFWILIRRFYVDMGTLLNLIRFDTENCFNQQSQVLLSESRPENESVERGAKAPLHPAFLLSSP